MKCRTGKVRYKDHISAKIALALTSGRRRTAHQETRTYPCPICKGWHLTSKEKR